MYQFAVPTSEDFEIQCYIKVVENMDWVSLTLIGRCGKLL